MDSIIDFIFNNARNIIYALGLIWSTFGFLYLLHGLPKRMEALEEWRKEYEGERLPPRVGTLETDVKRIEKEIYTIKADLQENNRITLNTYELVKDMRDELVRHSIQGIRHEK